MPDRDGAAVRIDDLRVDAPGADARQRLRGERLVELDRADVAPADASTGQGNVGGLHRGEPEELRLAGGRAPARDPGERRQAGDGLGGGAAEQRCGRAVAER